MIDTPIPTHYVIRTTTVRCAGCAAQTHVSEFFAHYLIASRNHVGAAVRQHKYCAKPEFNLEVRRESGTMRNVPFCSSCPPIDLSHLPPPPSADRVYDLADVALKHRPAQRPVATKPTRLSIKDLA